MHNLCQAILAYYKNAFSVFFVHIYYLSLHKICKNMSTKDKRAAVFGLWKVGSSIYYAINQYKQLSAFCDRLKCDRPKSVDTQANRNKIRNRIRRNPYCSLRKLAKDLEISTWSLRKIIKNKLPLQLYKLLKVQFLNDKMKATQLK